MCTCYCAGVWAGLWASIYLHKFRFTIHLLWRKNRYLSTLVESHLSGISETDQIHLTLIDISVLFGMETLISHQIDNTLHFYTFHLAERIHCHSSPYKCLILCLKLSKCFRISVWKNYKILLFMLAFKFQFSKTRKLLSKK